MTLHLPRGRSERDRLIDLLLVLCTAEKIAALNKSPGGTVTQKIFFWANIAAKATHHAFVRYTFGPFSPELRDDRSWLVNAKLLRAADFAPTARGSEIARHWRAVLEGSNREAFSALDESASKRAGWTADRAKREAYALKVTVDGHETTLAKLAALHPLTNGKSAFTLSDSDLQDLYLDLSTDEEQAAQLRGSGQELVELAPEALGV